MTALTESEIMSCLAENFRLAAEDCEKLAKLPAQGPTYNVFRQRLKLIEGAARQAGHWREDSRWFQVGMDMGKLHQKCGDWIRGRYPRELFLKAATALRQLHASTEKLRHDRTGRRGAILPDALEGPHRQNRPVSVMMPPVTKGGVFLPPGTSLH